MKRIIIISILFFISSSLFAQTGFGLKAGVNFSNLKFSNRSYTTSSLVGVHAGIFYNSRISEKTALQGEIQFSTEGNKWKTNSTKGEIKEGQVRIPVLVQYKLAHGIYAEAGPQYSLLLSIKQGVNGGEKEDIREFYKLGTFGYALGAGYHFKNNLSGVRAGLRYNGDFSKINNEEVGGNNLKNSVVQLTFMYTLSNNKK